MLHPHPNKPVSLDIYPGWKIAKSVQKQNKKLRFHHTKHLSNIMWDNFLHSLLHFLLFEWVQTFYIQPFYHCFTHQHIYFFLWITLLITPFIWSFSYSAAEMLRIFVSWLIVFYLLLSCFYFTSLVNRYFMLVIKTSVSIFTPSTFLPLRTKISAIATRLPTLSHTR